MAAIIKLETNIPLTGTIQYVDYYPEKPSERTPGTMMPAQWGLKGTFDGIGEGKVYLNVGQLDADMRRFISQQGDRWSWTYQGPVTILKREIGKKKVITVTPVAEGHAAPAAAPAPFPGFPAAQAAVATNPFHSNPGPNRAPLAGRNSQGAVASTAPVPDGWAALEARYARCAEIARSVWHHISDEQALVAAAATLLIESSKQGLPVPAATDPAASFAAMPAALRDDPADESSDLPF